VGATPHDDPNYAGHLSNLGNALRTRFQITGNPADIDEAVTTERDALVAIPHARPDRAKTLANLARALTVRFLGSGDLADIADIDGAIDAARDAVAATSPDDHDRAGSLRALIDAVSARLKLTVDLADIDLAIELHGEILQDPAFSMLSASWRVHVLRNAGAAFLRRHHLTEDPADLQHALDPLQEGIELAAPASEDLGSCLFNLAQALYLQYEHSGERSRLVAAIAAYERIRREVPDDVVLDLPWVLMFQGHALHSKALSFDPAALDPAIEAYRRALDLTPEGSPEYPERLSGLGIALRERFHQTGRREDIDQSIELQGLAVASSADNLSTQYAARDNLGRALRDRYDSFGAESDLNQAIVEHRRAVEYGGDPPSAHANAFASLGRATYQRYRRTGDLSDLDAAIAAARQAVAVEAAPPRVRVLAAGGWGSIAAEGRRWQEAVAGFAAAAELLGLVAPRSLPRGDQERLLEELGSLGADAVACCVHAGLTDRAVELFEQGRGVLLGQALDTRTDLTALTEQHPGLAARFTVLRDDLDRVGDPAGPPAATPAGMDREAAGGRAEAARRDIERRRAAAVAFDQVVAEIRNLPGFHGFLRPPPVAELLAATAEGPVVVVTVSRFGSYALILTDSGVLDPVPLTGLTPETVYDQVVAFLGALEDAWSPPAGAGGRAAGPRPGDTLGWLWEALASPVLDRLGITGPPRDGQPWPRLWWCVPGLLSFLPVHAAGHHYTRADAAPATVLDRVISSYTPTIRALTHARRPRPAVTGDRGDRPGARDQVVTVVMPHTPGAPDLPGAQAEAAGLQQRFPGQVTVLTGADATHDRVLAALPAGQWAHFACHGTSDLNNPSASCLLLTDHQQRPLTVVDVARLRLDDAGLAFLSACSTARPGARLADEAIHLASAFQLAGYRHVIATLWPIGDQHAVDITDHIYTTLTTTGGSDVAGAVHAAVRQMRQQWGPDTPSAWASHIHAGA
jgi:tetratricopeptide (TPR) repeat protein